MYADDVAAVITAPTLDVLEIKLNSVASQLAQWFHCNGLVLNVTKTQFICFDLSGRARRRLVVGVDGVQLQQVNTASFLGFQLDQTLSWEFHIEALCGKLARSCFALSRVSSTMTKAAVRVCYFATIQSLLQYGIEFWGRAADCERAFRLQRRAVRTIAGIPADVDEKPYFVSLKVLTLPGLLIFQVAMYARANLHLFEKRADVERYNLRNGSRLQSVPHRLEKGKRTIHAMSPYVYNKLPQDVTSSLTISTFKYKLKKWLVEQAFYTYNEFLNFK